MSRPFRRGQRENEQPLEVWQGPGWYSRGPSDLSRDSEDEPAPPRRQRADAGGAHEDEHGAQDVDEDFEDELEDDDDLPGLSDDVDEGAPETWAFAETAEPAPARGSGASRNPVDQGRKPSVGAPPSSLSTGRSHLDLDGLAAALNGSADPVVDDLVLGRRVPQRAGDVVADSASSPSRTTVSAPGPRRTSPPAPRRRSDGARDAALAEPVSIAVVEAKVVAPEASVAAPAQRRTSPSVPRRRSAPSGTTPPFEVSPAEVVVVAEPEVTSAAPAPGPAASKSSNSRRRSDQAGLAAASQQLPVEVVAVVPEVPTAEVVAAALVEPEIVAAAAESRPASPSTSRRRAAAPRSAIQAPSTGVDAVALLEPQVGVDSIPGMGVTMAARLRQAGLGSVDRLALLGESDYEETAANLGTFPVRLAGWVEHARVLANA